MSPILLVVLLTILANFIIAFLVFRNNPKSATNRLLAYLSLTTILWTIANYISQLPSSEATRLLWVRMVMFVTTPYGTTILLLSKTFPNAELKLNKYLKWGLIFFNIITAILALSPYMFLGVKNSPDGSFELIPGWGMLFYTVGYMGFMAIGFFNLIRKFIKSSGYTRQQLGFFAWGILLSFSLLTLTNFVAVNIFHTVELAALGPAFTLILFGFTSYAIIKHRFLDINYLAVRALSYVLLLAILVSGYIVVLFNLAKVLPISVNETLLSVIMVIIASFSFTPLKNLLERLTDKVFFKGRYDTEALLSELTHIMATEIIITHLSDRLLNTLIKKMRLTRAAFILLKDKEIEDVKQIGFEKQDLKDDRWSSLFSHKKDYCVFEDVPEGQTKDLFRDLGISAVFPLKVKNNLMGILVLGPKSSGDIYSNQDIELLEIFAPQAAIALQNSESYRKIRNFNRTLEKKVEERTSELKNTQKRELKKAKELLKVKDEFVFIATHDLGTPVTAINGFTYLLEEEKNKLSKKGKENIELLKEASKRLTSLTNDLLQVARSESHTIKVVTEKIDIIPLVEKTIKQISTRAKERDITIETKFHKKHALALADEEKLSEVMENLLSNAIKYNKDKGKITVSTQENKDSIKIEVSDTGIGIPQKDYPKVFQKFSRLHQAGTENTPGTGLGLFVVRMMIEKMKGKISFTSEEGQGTTFHCSLPKA